jgi:hypothetical protein
MSFVFLHGACSKREFLVSYYNQDGSFIWNNVHAARTVFKTVTAVIVERLHTRVLASLMSCVIHQRTVLTDVLQYIVLVILDLRVLLWVDVA